MRLVDTSAWIEWLTGSPTGSALIPELPARTEWLVPTIVQLELAKWLTRELSEDEDKADQIIAFSQTCIVVDLNTAVAFIGRRFLHPPQAGYGRRDRLCHSRRERCGPAHLRSGFC